MDGTTDGRKGYFVDILCSLFRPNRHFTAHFDLVDIFAAYFDLMAVFDVMTSDKMMDVSLKNWVQH